MNTRRKALINRACEFIRHPACWTQSVAARAQLSRPISPLSTEAKKFCAFGALTRAMQERGLPDRWLIEIFNPLALIQVIHAQ